MLQEDKQILWRTSAVLIGAALPTILIGKAVMFGLLGLGMLSGLLATKDESLRATVRLILDSWFSVSIVALLGVMLVGVFTGINPAFAFDKWLQMCVVAICAGGMFVTLREMPGRHLELLLKALAIATMAAAGLGLLDALVGDARLSGALHGADKALTPYRLNFLSSALAVLMPFVWARLLLKSREGEPFAQRIALPAACFGTVAALVCGGRAGWAGLFVAVAAFVWLAGRYHSLIAHRKHYALAAGVIGLSVVLYGLSFGWDFAVGRMLLVGEADTGRGILSGRMAVWMAATRHLLDAPLFGIGLMNYRHMPDAIDMHPHNWFLQMLLETGVAGTAIFLGMIGLILNRFLQFAKGNIYGVAAFASTLAFLVAGLANTSIFNAWWLTFFAFGAILGWRAGWGGDDLKKRRRGRIVK